MALHNQNSISFELLLDYVEGLVDPATQKDIEAFLAKNEDYRTVVEGIQYYYQTYSADREQLEAYLATFQQKLIREQVPGRTRRLNTRFLSIAATVLGLVFSGFLLWNLFSGNSSDQLVASALDTPYANVYATSRSNTSDTIRAQLSTWYDQQAYDQIVNQLKSNNNLSPTDQFMLAQSYLNMERPDYEQAANLFQQLLDKRPPEALLEQTQWYLALSQYQSGKAEIARSTFERIATQANHYRQEAAAAILNAWK